jgi:hypothetical protein
MSKMRVVTGSTILQVPKHLPWPDPYAARAVSGGDSEVRRRGETRMSAEDGGRREIWAASTDRATPSAKKMQQYQID